MVESMKQAFEAWKPGAAVLSVVQAANAICQEYAAAGYDLTLRQLYYQFVSRNLLPNEQKSYKRLGDIVNSARLAGLTDWDYIVDRTRNLVKPFAVDSMGDILKIAHSQFKLNPWLTQDAYVEVWVEKDALLGVIEKACHLPRVPFFSCRGYTSQSEMYDAAQRLREARANGSKPIILHLGDHDPSGVDMTRDIAARLSLFSGAKVEVRRLALNMAQIKAHNPPPNPAKLTDSRYEAYEAKHGQSSWELDALEPSLLVDIVRRAITGLVDAPAWAKCMAEEKAQKAKLADFVETLGY